MANLLKEFFIQELEFWKDNDEEDNSPFKDLTEDQIENIANKLSNNDWITQTLNELMSDEARYLIKKMNLGGHNNGNEVY